MPEIIFRDEAYAIMGACFEVYNKMGVGFGEPVYHECLKIEFELRGLPASSKPELILEYKGRRLVKTYEPDFVCYNQIIVELKAVSDLNEEHRAQVHNYLKATGFRLGLLINFGGKQQLQYERIVR